MMSVPEPQQRFARWPTSFLHKSRDRACRLSSLAENSANRMLRQRQATEKDKERAADRV